MVSRPVTTCKRFQERDTKRLSSHPAVEREHWDCRRSSRERTADHDRLWSAAVGFDSLVPQELVTAFRCLVRVARLAILNDSTFHMMSLPVGD
jgi:hypothetical protein